MAISRREYENMASRFKYVLGDPAKDRQTVLTCIHEFCIMASQFNANFNRAKFEIACGLEPTP